MSENDLLMGIISDLIKLAWDMEYRLQPNPDDVIIHGYSNYAKEIMKIQEKLNSIKDPENAIQ